MAVLSGSHATGIRSVSGVVEPTRYRNQRTARIGRKCAAGASGRSRRRISARGLANIRAAQKARWAKARGMQKTMSVAKPGKRTISVATRRKIAPSQRTRLGKNQSCEQVNHLLFNSQRQSQIRWHHPPPATTSYQADESRPPRRCLGILFEPSQFLAFELKIHFPQSRSARPAHGSVPALHSDGFGSFHQNLTPHRYQRLF